MALIHALFIESGAILLYYAAIDERPPCSSRRWYQGEGAIGDTGPRLRNRVSPLITGLLFPTDELIQQLERGVYGLRPHGVAFALRVQGHDDQPRQP